jgi:DNA-binding GntR family transcriptional regulator
MAQRSIRPLERPPPLRQQVYEALEDLIIYGALTPGQHLVEAELASRLGVSRIPVREALQLLHRDGWVDLRPRRGAFVHRPTLREVDEVFTMRTLLEAESIRMATGNLADKDMQALRRLLDAGNRALLKNDEKELVKLNSAFHGRITEIAGNRVLSEMIARLDKRIRWYFAPVVRSRGEDSWNEHAEVAEAMEARDPERAAELMRAHAELTRAAYHASRGREATLGPRATPSRPNRPKEPGARR